MDKLTQLKNYGVKFQRFELGGFTVLTNDAPVTANKLLLRSVTQFYDPLPNLRLSKKDSVVIDVGAYIGTFSMYASREISGRVFAIESYHLGAAFIRANLELNNIDNVVVIEKALALHDGEQGFYESASANGGMLISNIDKEQTRKMQKTSFPCIKIESIIKKHNIDKIDFLKMNCEGAEGIIVHWSDFVIDKIKRISFSFHPSWCKESGDKIYEFLKDKGFNIKLRGHHIRNEHSWWYCWKDK